MVFSQICNVDLKGIIEKQKAFDTRHCWYFSKASSEELLQQMAFLTIALKW